MITVIVELLLLLYICIHVYGIAIVGIAIVESSDSGIPRPTIPHTPYPKPHTPDHEKVG